MAGQESANSLDLIHWSTPCGFLRENQYTHQSAGPNRHPGESARRPLILRCRRSPSSYGTTVKAMPSSNYCDLFNSDFLLHHGYRRRAVVIAKMRKKSLNVAGPMDCDVFGGVSDPDLHYCVIILIWRFRSRPFHALSFSLCQTISIHMFIPQIFECIATPMKMSGFQLGNRALSTALVVFLAIMGRIEHVTDSGAKKESDRVWIMGINTELQRPRKPIFPPHLSRLS